MTRRSPSTSRSWSSLHCGAISGRGSGRGEASMPVRSLRRRSAATLAVVAALALVATGCSSDEGLTLIDEIEDIAVGDAPTLTVNLDAGNYVLICNIYDATEDEAHYQEGMFVGFTVE